MQHRLTSDLVRIAAAGGGLDLEAGQRLTSDLVRIASAMAGGGGTLILRGMTHRPTSDLVRIASAGRGRVIFAA
jgi:hypothetical protein